MIPLRRPPFGIKTVIAGALAGEEGVSLHELETAYAKAARMSAIWLPSARAGIAWALRKTVVKDAPIIAPAFTCVSVHQALTTVSRNLVWLEPAPGSFLPSLEMLASRSTSDYAVVLSEVYGHTFDLAQLSRIAKAPPAIRIVDMAMTVAHPSLFSRLEAQDFGVISFGVGKCMYAGWGAMGFTRNDHLAVTIRKTRAAALARFGFRLKMWRAAGLLARVIGNYPIVHSPARKIRDGFKRRGEVPAALPEKALSSDAVGSPGPEWRLPSTGVDRTLAIWNLEHAPESHNARVELARQYQRNLAAVKGIVVPNPSADALCHFTIRIPAAHRAPVKMRLEAAGISTATLWPFSPLLEPEIFPETLRLSREVLNLPLAPWMSVSQVDQVCEALVRATALD